MDNHNLMESASNFAYKLTSYFFDFIGDEHRVMVQRQLEEAANELGVSVNTLKTWLGLLLMAAGGYLLFLNLFFFFVPFGFLIFFIGYIGYVLVRDLQFS